MLAIFAHMLTEPVYPFPQDVRESAYKGLVCPVQFCLGSTMCYSTGELESVQKRAARFVTVTIKLGV